MVSVERINTRLVACITELRDEILTSSFFTVEFDRVDDRRWSCAEPEPRWNRKYITQ
jgi:hypothetical protein